MGRGRRRHRQAALTRILIDLAVKRCGDRARAGCNGRDYPTVSVDTGAADPRQIDLAAAEFDGSPGREFSLLCGRFPNAGKTRRTRQVAGETVPTTQSDRPARRSAAPSAWLCAAGGAGLGAVRGSTSYHCRARYRARRRAPKGFRDRRRRWLDRARSARHHSPRGDFPRCLPAAGQAGRRYMPRALAPWRLVSRAWLMVVPARNRARRRAPYGLGNPAIGALPPMCSPGGHSGEQTLKKVPDFIGMDGNLNQQYARCASIAAQWCTIQR